MNPLIATSSRWQKWRYSQSQHSARPGPNSAIQVLRFSCSGSEAQLAIVRQQREHSLWKWKHFYYLIIDFPTFLLFRNISTVSCCSAMNKPGLRFTQYWILRHISWGSAMRPRSKFAKQNGKKAVKFTWRSSKERKAAVMSFWKRGSRYSWIPQDYCWRKKCRTEIGAWEDEFMRILCMAPLRSTEEGWKFYMVAAHLVKNGRPFR